MEGKRFGLAESYVRAKLSKAGLTWLELFTQAL